MKARVLLRNGALTLVGAGVLTSFLALSTNRAAFAAIGSRFTGSVPAFDLTAGSARTLDRGDPWNEGSPGTFEPSEISNFHARRTLDTSDPWSSFGTLEVSSEDTRRELDVHRAKRAIDVHDPWKDIATADESRMTAAVRASDRALRRAIKAAVDAGDFERAQVLLEVLQKSRAQEPSR